MKGYYENLENLISITTHISESRSGKLPSKIAL